VLDLRTVNEIRDIVYKTLGTVSSFLLQLTEALKTPPPIGGTTPNAGTFTTLTATGATALVDCEKFTLSYNSAASVNLTNMPNATLVDQVYVDVTTAFNAVGPTVTVGVAGDTDRYTNATDVNLAVVGAYCMDIAYYQATAAQMVATFAAGTGGTTGAAVIYTFTTQPK
jgi:hypothetical protein